MESPREFRVGRMEPVRFVLKTGLLLLMTVGFGSYLFFKCLAWFRGGSPPAIDFAVLIPLFIVFWYMQLVPPYRAVVRDSVLSLKSPLRSREIPVAAIRQIRPFLLSRDEYVLTHVHGSVLFLRQLEGFEELVRSLIELNPAITLRGTVERFESTRRPET